MANCIEHNDDTASMAIYADHAWCFGCERYWSPEELMLPGLRARVGTVRKTAHRKAEPPKRIPRSMVEVYHAWLTDGPFKDRLEWLQARGLVLDTLRANLIGHCGNAFTIPVFNEDGSVAGIRYRRDDKLADEGSPKYWGTRGANAVKLYRPMPPKYYMQGTYETNHVYLCEGELDALRLAQESRAAVSLTNGAGAFKPEHVELFEGYSRVWIVYDQDEPGIKAGDRIRRLIGAEAVHVMWPSVLGKDVTELLQRYPPEALFKFMKEARDQEDRC